MTQYELMVMVEPALWEKGIEDVLWTLKDLIKDGKGKIEKEDVWGEKLLGYKIHGSTKAYYMIYTLDIEGTKLKELTKSINLTKGIWRHLFVKKGS